jgi:ATP-dependent RNA helicase DDX5/DBP2
MPEVPLPWKAEKDPNTGATYYWNTETNETSWEVPKAANGAPNGTAGCAANGGGAYAARDVFVSADLGGSNGAPGDIKAWRATHEVIVSAGCPDPILSFAAANLPPQLLSEVTRAGFPSPSPIQSQAWSVANQGRDMVGIAKTGSGKTLAFLMPAFLQILTRRPDPRGGPYALVLAPTRELATQILDECHKFGRAAGMSATCCYGGSPKGAQLRDLQRGVYVVIATPGRLNDFLETRQVNLSSVAYLVLDEADRMLDMGFEPQIRRIIAALPRERQTLMFTATWPQDVRRLASEFQNAPVQITIGAGGDRPTANKDITQRVEMTPTLFDKERRLMETLMKHGGPGVRVLIFCSTKR